MYRSADDYIVLPQFPKVLIGYIKSCNNFMQVFYKDEICGAVNMAEQVFPPVTQTADVADFSGRKCSGIDIVQDILRTCKCDTDSLQVRLLVNRVDQYSL